MGPLGTILIVGALIAANVASSKGDTKEEKMENFLKNLDKKK